MSKKFLSIVLAITLVLVLVACGKSDDGKPADDGSKPAEGELPQDDGDDSDAADGKELNIALITMDSMDEHWLSVQEGATDKAKELGNVNITFNAPAGKTDPNEQVRMVEDAISRKVDAIMLAPLDKAALSPVVDEAKAANIPLILVDSPVETDNYDAFFSTDNLAAATMAADELAKLIGEKGKVAIINAQAGSGTGMLRENGFKDRMEEKYPDIEIVAIQYSDGDKAKALNQATDIMTAHPDLAGFYGCNEGSTVGIAQAIDQKGVAGKVFLVGFDKSQDTITAIENGLIQATMVQNPYNMGFLGVQAAVDVINGKSVDKDVDTGVMVVTKDNLDEIK